MVWPRDQNAPREVGEVSHVVCYTKGRVTQMPAKQKWSDYVSDQTWFPVLEWNLPNYYRFL